MIQSLCPKCLGQAKPCKWGCKLDGTKMGTGSLIFVLCFRLTTSEPASWMPLDGERDGAGHQMTTITEWQGPLNVSSRAVHRATEWN